MHGIELKQLRHFVAVVDCGSLSAASHILHLTQPAITRSIKNLEAQMRATLLDREARGVKPTEAGRSLYRRAKLIINEMANTVADVSAAAAGGQGRLDIGIAPIFASALTDEIIIALTDRFPKLELHVSSRLYDNLIAELTNGTLDLVLTNLLPGKLPEGIRAEPLLDVHVNFFAGAGHPLASAKVVDEQALLEAQWILVTPQQTGDLFERYFMEFGARAPAAASPVASGGPQLLGAAASGWPTIAGQPVNRCLETNSLPLLCKLLQSGRFVTALPLHMVHDQVQSGQVVSLPVAGTPLVRKAGVLVRDHPVQRSAVSHFLDIARALAGNWIEGFPQP